MRELDEVRRGPQGRHGEDVRRVALVQVGERGRQVAQRQRGVDAVGARLPVAAQPVAGSQRIDQLAQGDILRHAPMEMKSLRAI